MPRRPGARSNPNAASQAQTVRKAMASRIAALRQQHGWTLKEMAARLGVPFSVYTKYEYGVHAPPPEKLIQLAEILETTTDHLLTGGQTEGRPLAHPRLLERFHAIEHLPSEDIEAAIIVLDGLAVRREVESAVAKRATPKRTHD